MDVIKADVSRHITDESPLDDSHVHFRKPQLNDGSALWKLVQATGVLDVNSPYCYLMITHYFQDTSIVAESKQGVVGFISAFMTPGRPDTLFVWQVAVDQSMRRQGIGVAMLQMLLKRNTCENVRFLETTISADNLPSERMFRRLAQEWRADVEVSEGFPAHAFPESTHENERLFRIGPRST